MDCFVISPIGAEGSEIRKRSDEVLEYIIKDAVEPLGYKVIRADTISESGIITSQIIEKIVESDLVVADLTGHNANVFYELAIRHLVKKPFLQLIQDGEVIPFDVASSRTVFYSLDLSGARKASAEVRRQAMACKEADAKIENPISVAIDLNFLSESKNPTETALSRIESELTKLRHIVESSIARNENASLILEQIFPNAKLDEFKQEFLPGNALYWTDERVEQLKLLWAEGYSATQIGRKLGNVSRNAVIGKVHRLGLASKTSELDIQDED